MKNKQAFADCFSVGYDNLSGDIPVLVIGRVGDRGIDVINVFTNKEAEDLYKKLTTPRTLKNGKGNNDE